MLACLQIGAGAGLAGECVDRVTRQSRSEGIAAAIDGNRDRVVCAINRGNDTWLIHMGNLGWLRSLCSCRLRSLCWGWLRSLCSCRLAVLLCCHIGRGCGCRAKDAFFRRSSDSSTGYQNQCHSDNDQSQLPNSPHSPLLKKRCTSGGSLNSDLVVGVHSFDTEGSGKKAKLVLSSHCSASDGVTAFPLGSVLAWVCHDRRCLAWACHDRLGHALVRRLGYSLAPVLVFRWAIESDCSAPPFHRGLRRQTSGGGHPKRARAWLLAGSV